MEKNLYIDASHPNETRVVLKSGSHIEDYEYEGLKNTLTKNNIYLGKVSRIEPSLQAAFIDFGRDRHGFLSFNDIQSDYYQIPRSDLEKLKAEEEKAREELSREVQAKDEENLADGKLDVSDPVEKDETEDKEENSDQQKKRERENKSKFRRYKIQEVIKPNQVILIQVIKDERGQKGAALSTFISIAGKYIVLMPNTPKGGGISRKIFNPIDRKKIRSILNEIEIPKEMGLIVRTAGCNKTKNEISHDLKILIDTWNKIKDTAINSIAPSLIHQESEIIKRTLRDMYDENTKNIFIEGAEGYKKAQSFMKMMIPSHVKKIKKYRGKVPLFIDVGIEEKLNQIFDSEIKLDSGGYLVINPTEALVSIDINSGSSIKQKNVESTALDTNLEAAEEIARQIKIRDLSGLLIIDFIDMLSYGNRKLVERKLKEKCRSDRARIQIGKISTFGLLEMSRQRLRESAIKWKVSLTDESLAQKVLKLVEIKAVTKKAKFVELKVCEKISDLLKENFIENLDYFEEKNKMKIEIITDNTLLISEYTIDFQNKGKKTIELIKYIEKLNFSKKIEKNLKTESVKIISKKFKKKTHRKKNFFKKAK
jgi:ribonuclease E